MSIPTKPVGIQAYVYMYTRVIRVAELLTSLRVTRSCEAGPVIRKAELGSSLRANAELLYVIREGGAGTIPLYVKRSWR